jgi:hypothetical protein
MFLDSGKFCPACKMLNDSAAVFCVHCGVPFDRGLSRNDPTTHQVAETSFLTADDLSMLQDMERNIPENGIAIYLPNLANPFSVRSDDDFLIGRKTDESFDNVVDLSLSMHSRWGYPGGMSGSSGWEMSIKLPTLTVPMAASSMVNNCHLVCQLPCPTQPISSSEECAYTSPTRSKMAEIVINQQD